ncbi:MAG: acetylornithine transaminase, partial [Armatimonadetes bacterium]|nr:acetylornithine transaminase [Armatimonadota bacterium]
MNNAETVALTDQYVMKTYGRLPISFVRGEGCRLWDADGKQYLDFLAGISVVGTGHCHPKVVAAIREQAGQLMHTSNLFQIEPQAKLAKLLVENSCADKAFFCNSGAEANEAAIKLARKWALLHLPEGQRTIVSAVHSFHGRTLATVTATGQEKYHAPFAPLPPGFAHVPYDDLDAMRTAVDGTVCAILLEPIIAEGGILVPSVEYMQGVRQLCDEKGILLILDEVQTGLGRTGKLFGYEHFGIEPDIFTLAKALGGGFPIGACLAKDSACAFEPGNHAATFGGNHLATAAGCAAVSVILDEDLAGKAAAMGAFLTEQLLAMRADVPLVAGVRGKGLLLGLELSEPKGTQLDAACRERGLIVNKLQDQLIRLAPPLVLTQAEAQEALAILKDAMLA